MSTGIFEEKKLIVPTFFQKLFKVNPKENFLIEINNLLSKKDIHDITENEIKTIYDKFKENIPKEFKNDLMSFYDKYLIFHLNNGTFSDVTITGLEKYVRLFKLSEHDTKRTFEKLTNETYTNEVKKSISKGILDKESEEHLLKMEKTLLLPHDIAMKIYGENAQNILTDYLKKVISNERYTPEEEQELNLLAKNLNIGLSFDRDTQAVLDKYRLFWKIDNGDFPIISADISLQKSESCYFSTNIDWLEQRTVTTRVNYSGPTFRVKIVKGLYYRAGSVAPQRVTEDVWKVIDSGKLYLTNKRVIFMGGKGNKTLTINKILDFNVFSNGIEIQKDSGKSPFFSFSHNTDVFAVLLAKLLMEK